MSKPREWSVYDDQDVFGNEYLNVTREHMTFEKWIPVIEKSAYDELEQKYKILIDEYSFDDLRVKMVSCFDKYHVEKIKADKLAEALDAQECLCSKDRMIVCIRCQALKEYRGE